MILDAVVANKAAIGLAAFAALFVAERVIAASPAPRDPRRLLRNGALWALLAALSPTIVLPLTLAAAENPLWTRSFSANSLALVADIVLLDLWAYWAHRAYHEIGVMRRFHRVHHLDMRLDTTSAVRFHPGEVALSALLRVIPIIILAIPFVHVVIFETMMLVATLFHHSNVRLPTRLERALARVIVTPSIHWVHHHAVSADTNSNYAAIFSAWDRLFGTRSRTARSPTMKIGLEGVEEQSVVGLLLAPFQGIGKR